MVISTPTAMKDSQNPGANTDHGSHPTTTTPANNHTNTPGQGRPVHFDHASTPSMITVR